MKLAVLLVIPVLLAMGCGSGTVSSDDPLSAVWAGTAVNTAAPLESNTMRITVSPDHSFQGTRTRTIGSGPSVEIAITGTIADDSSVQFTEVEGQTQRDGTGTLSLSGQGRLTGTLTAFGGSPSLTVDLTRQP